MAMASDDDAADIARTIVGIIKEHHIVDVWSNEVAQNNMRNAIDDYFFDVVRDEKGIDIPSSSWMNWNSRSWMLPGRGFRDDWQSLQLGYGEDH